LAWRGAGGGHIGAGVQMSTVTLQVARAMPAWSVNWCTCSQTPTAFHKLAESETIFLDVIKFGVLDSSHAIRPLYHFFVAKFIVQWYSCTKVTTPKCDTCFSLVTWEGVVQKNLGRAISKCKRN
jgi:hypothetical protein